MCVASTLELKAQGALWKSGKKEGKSQRNGDFSLFLQSTEIVDLCCFQCYNFVIDLQPVSVFILACFPYFKIAFCFCGFLQSFYLHFLLLFLKSHLIF